MRMRKRMLIGFFYLGKIFRLKKATNQLQINDKNVFFDVFLIEQVRDLRVIVNFETTSASNMGSPIIAATNTIN
jgi:glycerol-3-phosphate responsive antiterminator